MPPRPNWKGYLKLSLVSCPIALYPAVSAADRVSFRQVNTRTVHRLRHQLVDSVTGEAVDTADKGRGYEVGEHQFLLVEDQDLDRARQARPLPGEPTVMQSPPLSPGRAAVPLEEDEATTESAVEEITEAAPAPPHGQGTPTQSRSNGLFPSGRSTRVISRSRTTSRPASRSVRKLSP